MENMGITEDINLHKNKVHRILAHSYLFYFIFFLLSLFLNFLFPFEIFVKIDILWIGFVFLVIGTSLILWAQNTSLNLKAGELSKESFYRGPYKYTRSPTHLGLFFLMLGFGIMSNSLIIVISSIISFVISKSIFLRKEEKILYLKYGSHYSEYKNSVKF